MDADTDWDKIADVVEKWAKEHTEPQYPTWMKWLALEGVTDACGFHFQYKAYQPIPADIAEKLGLKPKEAKD